MTIQFIISILGIIFRALPKLFYGFELNVSAYIESLKEVFAKLMDISNLQYASDKFYFHSCLFIIKKQ